MGGLCRVFLRSIAGKGRAGPDLTMRVRVRGAHDLAPVLEHLDPAIAVPKFGSFRGPDVHDSPDLWAQVALDARPLLGVRITLGDGAYPLQLALDAQGAVIGWVLELGIAETV